MGVWKGFSAAVSFKCTDVHIYLHLLLDAGQENPGGLSGLEASGAVSGGNTSQKGPRYCPLKTRGWRSSFCLKRKRLPPGVQSRFCCQLSHQEGPPGAELPAPFHVFDLGDPP